MSFFLVTRHLHPDHSGDAVRVFDTPAQALAFKAAQPTVMGAIKRPVRYRVSKTRCPECGESQTHTKLCHMGKESARRKNPVKKRRNPEMPFEVYPIAPNAYRVRMHVGLSKGKSLDAAFRNFKEAALAGCRAVISSYKHNSGATLKQHNDAVAVLADYGTINPPRRGNKMKHRNPPYRYLSGKTCVSPTSGLTYKVRFDTDYQEWQVAAFKDGKFQEGPTHYAGDKEEALSTLAAFSKGHDMPSKMNPGRMLKVTLKRGRKTKTVCVNPGKVTGWGASPSRRKKSKVKARRAAKPKMRRVATRAAKRAPAARAARTVGKKGAGKKDTLGRERKNFFNALDLSVKNPYAVAVLRAHLKAYKSRVIMNYQWMQHFDSVDIAIDLLSKYDAAEALEKSPNELVKQVISESLKKGEHYKNLFGGAPSSPATNPRRNPGRSAEAVRHEQRRASARRHMDHTCDICASAGITTAATLASTVRIHGWLGQAGAHTAYLCGECAANACPATSEDPGECAQADLGLM